MKKESYFDQLWEGLVKLRKGLKEMKAAYLKVSPFFIYPTDESNIQVTEKYPDSTSGKNKEDLASRSRGRLYNQMDQCTSCEQCVQVCPTRALTIDFSQQENSNKRSLIAFQINHLKCIQCGLCLDYCPPESLRFLKSLGNSQINNESFIEKINFEDWKREIRK